MAIRFFLFAYLRGTSLAHYRIADIRGLMTYKKEDDDERE